MNFDAFLMVFDVTQFWLDGPPGNEYFRISHKMPGLLTPLDLYSQCLLKKNLKQIESIPPSVEFSPRTETISEKKDRARSALENDLFQF